MVVMGGAKRRSGRRGWRPWVVMLLAALAASDVYAEIFKYQDGAGRLHFTDRPQRKAGYKLLWRSGAKKGGNAEFKRNRARYTPIIDKAARQLDLRPALLHAVVMAESAYDAKAVSKKGAIGLMQLMPATARRYGVSDRRDPVANVDGGARYLRDLLAEFNNNMELALAAYNAGENAVARYGNKIPPFPETRRYVRKVLGYYQRFRRSG